MVRVEDIGPVILDQVQQWLGHANVMLKPVIDLAGIQPVDHYETPPADLRGDRADPLTPTPGLYATSTSRHQDNEHTKPYVPMNRGGPPGQTDPLKMSKMTRRSSPDQNPRRLDSDPASDQEPGCYRSPHGYHFLVDQHGTTATRPTVNESAGVPASEHLDCHSRKTDRPVIAARAADHR